MAFKIHILDPFRRTIEASSDERLSRVLVRAGIPLSLYCGGKGICGRCLVEVLEGRLPPRDEEETAVLSTRKAAPRFRLACLLPVQSDLAVKIPPEALWTDIPGLTEGILPSFDFDPAVKTFICRLDRDLDSSSLLEARGANLLKLPLDEEWHRNSWPVLREAVRSSGGAPGAYTATVFDERLLLNFAAGESADRACGLAVDLGTTTVAVELINLVEGRIVEKAVGLNRQARFGADLISRISHAVLDSSHAEDLKHAALETLSDLLTRVCEGSKTSPGAVYDIALAGNTAMNHLLLGRSVRSLATAPFNAEFLSLPPLEASRYGFKVQDHARLFISPNIGSYVGGDITAGLLATDFVRRAGNALFVDLGTNGEIVLKSGEKITAASTAAGPAFEGASLSCGMLAVPGAVDGVARDKGALSLSTIGNKPPAGICGTGYIDLLALFLREGLISRSGVITSRRDALPVAEGILISQKDIRSLQLAVAAIRTGIELLLALDGLRPSDLDVVFLAGAFGNTLNIENGRRIGLLPDVDPDRIRFVGNTSLAGARAMLLSRQARSEAVEISGRVGHVSLASDAAFQDTYIRCLVFPE